MEELTRALEDVVRREKGRVVGGLVRALGSLDAAEDAFQEAVLAALPNWRANGAPVNPAAWLTTAAKNHARDALRHQRIRDKTAPLLVENEAVTDTLDSIADDELRLVFTCCHPVLTLDSQVALTLKVVAGFTTDEIARAFLAPEKTIAQRITRAKLKIEEEKLAYEVPERPELEGRLAAVLAVVYLVFNEGHTAREGPLMRLDLQAEAMHLARELCDLLPNEAEVFGLYALIAFSYARAATRVDADGVMVLLEDQDRARWDRRVIKEGLMALQRARRFPGGAYTLQAEIAACHATAETWAATDWQRILALYDELVAVAPSPIVSLNRAVALSMRVGPLEAMSVLAEVESALSGYHLFHAVRADFRSRLGQNAHDDLTRALALCGNDAERKLLQKKIDRAM